MSIVPSRLHEQKEAEPIYKDRPIAVFLHVATIGRYQFVLDEMLSALRDTRLVTKCAWIEVSVVGVGPVQLTDIGFDVQLTRRSADVLDFEHPTLSAIRRYCCDHLSSRVLYLNCLGGRHLGSEWEIRVEWRKLLRYLLLERFSNCLAALRLHDICGVQWALAPLPHATSNNWWANACYIASLPDLSEAVNHTFAADLSCYGDRWIDVEIKRRHSGEFWLGMQPLVRPFSLLDLGVTRLPRSQFGLVAWWEIAGIDWAEVARRQFGDRRFGWFDIKILVRAARIRASAGLLNAKRRLRPTQTAAATTEQTKHRH